MRERTCFDILSVIHTNYFDTIGKGNYQVFVVNTFTRTPLPLPLSLSQFLMLAGCP